MAGAGTVRAERYGRAVKDDALRAKRQDEGLAPEPTTVIVSAAWICRPTCRCSRPRAPR